MVTRAIASLAPVPRARALTSARGRAARASRRPLTTRASAGAAPDPESSPASETPPAASFSVVVFGANGKTGKRCVAHAAKAGVPVVACTRSGSFASADLAMSADDQKLVTAKAGECARDDCDSFFRFHREPRMITHGILPLLDQN